MEFVILEFESKVEEIDEYFSFVQTTTHLRKEFDENKIVKVSKTVHNVLKANLFLLLYNLIEPSFKNALEKICIHISSDELLYQDVVPAIKKMWIEKEYKNFENCSIPYETKKSEFIMNKIDNIAEDIIKLEFDKKNNNDISGNLDAREINKINSKYGATLGEEPDIDTHSLLTVKTQRNNLAHGDESFANCGENYSIPELNKIKDESIDYMRFILTHIESFINDKKYKK